jgi:hypothetical protein
MPSPKNFPEALGSRPDCFANGKHDGTFSLVFGTKAESGLSNLEMAAPELLTCVTLLCMRWRSECGLRHTFNRG